MNRLQRYSLQNAFNEGGAVKSYALPVDALMATGILFMPHLPDMDCPYNIPFLLGTVSILMNNRTENTLHEFPLYCYPDANGKMSLGNEFSRELSGVKLNTKIKHGNTITVVYKDSGYMAKVMETLPEFSDFDFNLDIYLTYNDNKNG